MEVVIALAIALGAAGVGSLLTWLFALPASRSQTRAQQQVADAQQELSKSQAALAASQAAGVEMQRRLAEAQERLADAEVERAKTDLRRVELETERAKWEALAAFLPVGRITGLTPGAQTIVVEAGQEFQAVRTDYCNHLGAAISSRELKPPLVGTRVEIPIAQDYLEYFLFDAGDQAGAGRERRLDITFRVHVVLLGHPRVVSVAARLEKQNGMTARLVG